MVAVESFDEKLLARQNRPVSSFEEIQRLIEGIRRRGMWSAVEVMYLMDSQDADAIFEQDLRLVSELHPEVVTLHMNFNSPLGNDKHAWFHQTVAVSALAGDYRWGTDVAWVPWFFRRQDRTLRLVRQDLPLEKFISDIFPFADVRDATLDPRRDHCGLPSVMALGSYRNPKHNSTSTIRGTGSVTEYIEVNAGAGNAGDRIAGDKAEYYLTYDSAEYFEALHTEIERLHAIGPAPPGIKLQLDHVVAMSESHTVYRQRRSAPDLRVAWDHLYPPTAAYVEELKRIFPEWQWS